MILNVNTKNNNYEIIIGEDILKNTFNYIVGKIPSLENAKFLIITDSGIPNKYIEDVKINMNEKNVFVKTIEMGEEQKTIDTYKNILTFMLKNGFSRKDCIITIGGGMIGDLGGFVASSFMRGIKYINIPTSFLAQVDSSIGGKVAVNLDNVKNVVGAFYQPSLVIIDINTLKSLTLRQFSSGLCESLKMAYTFNEDLVKQIDKINIRKYLEKNNLEFDENCINKNIDTINHLNAFITEQIIEDNKDLIKNIIFESLSIKKYVVEEDEKEEGLRKTLNFGHTIGHGIESFYEEKKYYHGEGVALGLLPMVCDNLRKDLIDRLNMLCLPTKIKIDKDKLINIIMYDKKKNGEYIETIICNRIGCFEIVKMNKEEIYNKLYIYES